MFPSQLCGPWACHADHVHAIGTSAPATAAAWSPGGGSPGSFAKSDGVAVIDLAGPLTKQGGWWFGGTSSVRAAHQIAAAAADTDVGKILLRIDSPGGTVDGTFELAAAVAAAARQKPLTAFVQDMAASAAYWVASQAREVFASPTSRIGSIGTYAVLIDSSEMAEKIGIKVHVIRAGAFKGAGAPGTKIKPEHLADAQRQVDALNEFFLAGVAAGRRLPPQKVRDLADGRVHVAADAQQLRLIDGVQSFQQTYARLAVTGSGFSPAAPRGPNMEDRRMSDTATYDGDAKAEFAELIREIQKEKGCDRPRAVQLAAVRNPELHKAYLRATNPGKTIA